MAARVLLLIHRRHSSLSLSLCVSYATRVFTQHIHTYSLTTTTVVREYVSVCVLLLLLLYYERVCVLEGEERSGVEWSCDTLVSVCERECVCVSERHGVRNTYTRSTSALVFILCKIQVTVCVSERERERERREEYNERKRECE